MEYRKVSKEEEKVIRLDIIRSIDQFCRKNGLKYFLAYGTLLGAIRHKGYIPWDDDADLMMPRRDLEILKKTYKSDRFKYSDVDTEYGYEFPFPRITCLETFDMKGKNIKYYGVNVDLYPIDGLPQSNDEIAKFFSHYKRLLSVRIFLIKVRRKLMSYFSIKNIIGIRFLTKKCISWTKKYDYDNSSFVMCSDSRAYNRSIFEGAVEVEFENERFYAPIGYDDFLKTSYGDYMKLPPENQRIAYHGGNYYWKN